MCLGFNFYDLQALIYPFKEYICIGLRKNGFIQIPIQPNLHFMFNIKTKQKPQKVHFTVLKPISKAFDSCFHHNQLSWLKHLCLPWCSKIMAIMSILSKATLYSAFYIFFVLFCCSTQCSTTGTPNISFQKLWAAVQCVEEFRDEMLSNFWKWAH